MSGARRTSSQPQGAVQNQQISGAAGGPIVRDQVHYFGNYEYEHAAADLHREDPLPAVQHRVERQGNDQTGWRPARLPVLAQRPPDVQGDRAKRFTPFGSLGANHLANAAITDEDTWRTRHVDQRPLESRAQRDQGGLFLYALAAGAADRWSNHPQAAAGITAGRPIIRFRGFQIAGSAPPAHLGAEGHTIRDDFTFLRRRRTSRSQAGGRVSASAWTTLATATTAWASIPPAAGPAPTEAQMRAWFPVRRTWTPGTFRPQSTTLVQRYEIALGDFYRPDTLPKYGAWIQDDWQIADRLTLNLGLRYDLIWNAFAQHRRSCSGWPIGRRTRTTCSRDSASPSPSTTGRSCAAAAGSTTTTSRPRRLCGRSCRRRSRSSAWTPMAGPISRSARSMAPGRRYDQALQRFCYVRNVPGCLFRDLRELPPTPEFAAVPLRWQSSVGFQRQFGGNSALTVDYVYFHGRDENILDNINMTFDEATGGTIRPRTSPARFSALGHDRDDSEDRPVRLPRPADGVHETVQQPVAGVGHLHVVGLLGRDPQPISGFSEVPFPVARSRRRRSLADADQRHRPCSTASGRSAAASS